MQKLLGVGLLCLIMHGYCAEVTTLRVGTTGDYPPLTYKSESGDYSGRDIQIINSFAASHHLTIKWVTTTWPSLNQDLLSDKFMVAVGGISLNASRESQFWVSLPVGVTAKAALIRCTDLPRFKTLADIDQESIVVAENRGGTNQTFALNNLHHAQVVLVTQNFQALAKVSQPRTTLGAADVMFTDDVEIAYRHQLNPNLCQAQLSEHFPSQNKVFLFRRDTQGRYWQLQFDQWWQGQRLAN